MRTVKVRILPPQPKTPIKSLKNRRRTVLIPLLIPISSRKSRCFPTTQYLSRGDLCHGPQSKVSLYRLFTVGEKHRYVPIVRKGRSWGPKTEPTGTPSSRSVVFIASERLSFSFTGGGICTAVRVKSFRITRQVLYFHSKPGRERLRGGILQKNEREA